MSPHFGLMDPDKMSPVEAALMRAKLHWRGGCRRLREKKTAAGIAALYDAMLCGLRWYFLVHRPEGTEVQRDLELEDETVLFTWGRKAGILDESIDTEGIQALVDRALTGGDIDPALGALPGRIERLLTRIGILPFDEGELPPEDPATF